MDNKKFVEKQKQQLEESKRNVAITSFCLYAVTILLKKAGIEEEEKGESSSEFYDLIISTWIEYAKAKVVVEFDQMLKILNPGSEELEDLKKMREDNIAHIDSMASTIKENLYK